jgi:DNA-binding LacI/PurR family transcriptional regulator
MKINGKKDFIVEKIIRSIQIGEYVAGCPLPPERYLCNRYKVSRTTIRGVFQELENIGAIIREKNCRAKVNPDYKESDILSTREGENLIEVCFSMGNVRFDNPLFRAIFQECLSNLNKGINVSVDFQDYIKPSQYEECRFDAMVFDSCFSQSEIMESGFPEKKSIYLNAKLPAGNYLSINNLKAGEAAAQYIINKTGHTHIGAVTGNLSGGQGEFHERLEGMKQTLGTHSLQICEVVLDEQNGNVFSAIDHLLALSPELSLICSFCDKQAVKIYGALKQKGIRIPDQISVISFDDQLYSRFLNPPLTTVKYPAEAMGLKLAAALNQYQETGKLYLREEMIPLLVERGSVKA